MPPALIEFATTKPLEIRGKACMTGGVRSGCLSS
jgi:hypothetical protein